MRVADGFERVASRLVLGLAFLVCAAGLAGVVAHPRVSSRHVPPPAEARRPVAGFLASYVDSSGRVVRRDQGGDTVSEGQAYALLIAVAAGNRARFSAVWAWTRAHLQRPDGLLSWHWDRGRVVDRMPAADADLDTAWALGLASARWHEYPLAVAARRMAASILAEETVSTSLGTVLVAGPWARTSPALIEPGYFSPEAFAGLARVTGDSRWVGVSSTAMAILARLTRSGLPPDWASVTPEGAVAPASPPGSSSPPSYGLDAARSVVWAAGCGSAGTEVAARVWGTLERTASHGTFPLKLSLGGAAETSDVSPLIAVADGAAAGAHGSGSAAAAFLQDAARLAARYPTYYGSAWLAIADSLLSAHTLDTCRSR